jgi:hypothetical protein
LYERTAASFARPNDHWLSRNGFSLFLFSERPKHLLIAFRVKELEVAFASFGRLLICLKEEKTFADHVYFLFEFLAFKKV